VLNAKVINALSPLFYAISANDQQTLWVRDKLMNKQLYLSDTFARLLKMDTTRILETSDAITNSVLEEDRKAFITGCTKRIESKAQNHQEISFRAKDSQGKLFYFYDVCFPLMNDKGETLAIAGTATALNPESWRKTQALNFKDKQRFLENSLLKGLVQTEKKPAPIAPDHYCVYTNKKFHILTLREAQCLHYLSRGLPGKLIADKLNISPRTVEVYFYNLRNKFEQNSRLAILTIIENIDEVRSWSFK